MSGPNAMVRIPADLVPELDRLVTEIKKRLGATHVGACEVNRSFVHHLALRLGIPALQESMASTCAKLKVTGIDESVLAEIDRVSDVIFKNTDRTNKSVLLMADDDTAVHILGKMVDAYKQGSQDE